MLIITQTGCVYLGAEESKPVSREEYLLDTICSISIYHMKDEKGGVVSAGAAEDEALSLIDDTFSLCRELEDKLSRTRSDSDISRLNDAEGEWTEVNDDTLELIQKGVEYSELSGGGFDITIGGVTELWDFHAAEGEEKLPNEKALTEAVKHVGFDGVEIRENKVRLKDPKAQIDLGGIAKGYIGDRMTERLEAAGVTSGIINLGGNVICISGKSDNEDFIIGVETPFSDRTEIIGKISARDKTLVTSGVYERKLEIEGKVYHHILDTETGWPAETDLDAVTLVADKGHSADIDALSTICLIKGSEEGFKLIDETEGIEGIFIMKDGAIKQTIKMLDEGIQ